jgi:hypothetical protein
MGSVPPRKAFCRKCHKEESQCACVVPAYDLCEEACLGCGKLIHSSDCGCPAGTNWKAVQSLTEDESYVRKNLRKALERQCPTEPQEDP